MPAAKGIRIALVDDHNLFRKGLIKLINLGDTENKYTIVFEADSGKEMQERIDKKLLPDIILMDIDMPDMDGYEAVMWLRKYHPDIKILVISMFESEQPVLRMVQLGVNGYLSKDIEVEDMHQALEAIAADKFYYADFVSGIMADNLRSDGKNPNGGELMLTEREREFLKLVCTEKTYVQVADEMHLSPKTIDGYRDALFKKLQVTSRVGLAVFALRTGLVKFP